MTACPSPLPLHSAQPAMPPGCNPSGPPAGPTRRRPGRLAAAAGWAAALLLAATALPAAAQVGWTRLTLDQRPVVLVYPTAATARPVSMGPFTLTVATDAAPLPGPHRLVVMSHGTGGSAVADHDLAATLARAGFVVAQPLHGGDNHADTSRAGPESWVTRPQELAQTVSALAAHPQWRSVVKTDRVGVHGMSAGGGTALVMAGAQWRTLSLVRHCLAQGEADLGFCYNGLPDAAAQAPRRARYEAARGVPELFLPADLQQWHGGRTPDDGNPEVRPDARVASVTVSVPVAAIFSAESLARIRVPVGVVSAGRDTMLPPAFHSGHVLRHCRACTPLADLKGAAHMDLLSPWPAEVARREAAQQARGGAPEPGFDPAQRSAAFAAIAAFHRRHLGD